MSDGKNVCTPEKNRQPLSPPTTLSVMEQDTSQVQEQIVALKAQVESNEALLKNVTAKVDNIEMLLRQNYEVVQQVCNRSQLEDRAMKDIDTLKMCMANFQRMCSEIVTVLDPQSSARSTPSPTIESARPPPDRTIPKGEPANLSRPLRKYAIPTPLQPYTLSRTIVTVQDLWREWTAGLEPGQPSVLEMNRKYGSAWRKDPKGSVYSVILILLVCAHELICSITRTQALLTKS